MHEIFTWSNHALYFYDSGHIHAWGSVCTYVYIYLCVVLLSISGGREFYRMKWLPKVDEYRKTSYSLFHLG